MVKISGGGKLEGFLRQMTNKFRAEKKVQVGFMEDATYPDGTSVPLVAMMNEYGGTVNVPEHNQDIYRSINEQTGDFNRNGKFVKKADSNFMTTHVVGAHTITIPPRPFFRRMIAKEKGHWGADLAKFLKDATFRVDVALDAMGQEIGEELQDSIMSFTDPRNAPSTIRKKGFDAPLRETMDMYRSVDHRVVKK